MKKEQSPASLMQSPPAYVIVASAILLFFALLSLLALLSYNPADPAWRHNEGEIVKNSLGFLGAWYSDLSFSIIGKLGYLVPISLIAFAFHGWREKMIEKELFSWRLFMLVSAILSGCVLWAKHDAVEINSVAQTGGGAIGTWLIIGLQKSIQSTSIIMAFSTVIFIVSLSLLLNIPWARISVFVGAGITSLFSNLMVAEGLPKRIREGADVSSIRAKLKNLNKKNSVNKQGRQSSVAEKLAEEAGLEGGFVEDEIKQRPVIGRSYQPEEAFAADNDARSAAHASQQHTRQQSNVQIGENRAEPNLFGHMGSSSQKAQQPIQQRAAPSTNVQQARQAEQPIQQRSAPATNVQQARQAEQLTQQRSAAQSANIQQARQAERSTQQRSVAQSANVQQSRQAEQLTQQRRAAPSVNTQQSPQAEQPTQPLQQERYAQVAQPQVERPRQPVDEWLADINKMATRNSRSVHKPQSVSFDDLIATTDVHSKDFNQVVEVTPTLIPEAKQKVGDSHALTSLGERAEPEMISLDAMPQAKPSREVQVPQSYPAVNNLENSESLQMPMAQNPSASVSVPQAIVEPIVAQPQIQEEKVESSSKMQSQVANQSTAQTSHSRTSQSHVYQSLDDDDGLTQTVIHPHPVNQVAQAVVSTAAEKTVVNVSAVPEPLAATTPTSLSAVAYISATAEPASLPASAIKPAIPMATGRGVSQELPSIELLDAPPPLVDAYTEDTLAEMARVLEATLNQFKISATVMYVSPGPVITRFELELAPGIQAKKVTGLSQDLARALAVSRVRVEEVIPGSSYVGLEVPNKQRQTVYFRELVGSKIFRDSQSPLTISLGSDTSGKPKVVDLMKMPHALVAGTTGSGKSVCINVMLLSMLFKATPKDLRLILVDPKMLEMSMYEDIPHLLTPVITDMNEAENALTWAVGEMERRYQLMAALKVRKIDAFNEQVDAAIAKGEGLKDPLWKPDEQVGYTHHPSLERLPFIVIVIDELADMMMVVGKQVEQLIARLTQKARAAGIHVILATQRPSTDVLTGLIKANVPTRIAFQVSSGTDSRVIIDSVGAEKLLGHGDMLYVPPGVAHPQRLHGAFVGDAETDRITSFLRSTGEPDYIQGITGKQDPDALGAFGAQEVSESKHDLDPLYEEAIEIVIQTNKASISSVQRQLRIGYNRAARMIEDMQAQGIVSQPVHGIRQVIGRR